MDGRDVEIVERRPAHTGFLSVTVLKLRFRRFDGTWSALLRRELCERGEAVVILPYDPVRDHVLLVEQFRTGAVADPEGPWLLEPVAGIVDRDEPPEAVAKREAVEEAGLAIGALDRIGAAYPTPGGVSEKDVFFIGRADLPREAAGVFGLACEHEDIRTHVLTLDEALERLDAGAFRAVTTMVGLLWLARHRDRLRRLWIPDARA